MNIFKPEGKLFRWLSLSMDLIVLNLLTLFFVVPVLTAGTSFCAMHYVLLRLYRDECTSVFNDFIHAFRENLKQSVCLTIAWAVFWGILTMDFYLGSRANSVVLRLVVYLIPLFGILGWMCMTWSFILLFRYRNTVVETLKTALAACIAHPLRSVLIGMLGFIPLIVIFISAGLLTYTFVIGVSLNGYLQVCLYNSIFKKLEQPLEMKLPDDQPEFINK